MPLPKRQARNYTENYLSRCARLLLIAYYRELGYIFTPTRDTGIYICTQSDQPEGILIHLNKGHTQVRAVPLGCEDGRYANWDMNIPELNGAVRAPFVADIYEFYRVLLKKCYTRKGEAIGTRKEHDALLHELTKLTHACLRKYQQVTLDIQSDFICVDKTRLSLDHRFRKTANRHVALVRTAPRERDSIAPSP